MVLPMMQCLQPSTAVKRDTQAMLTFGCISSTSQERLEHKTMLPATDAQLHHVCKPPSKYHAMFMCSGWHSKYQKAGWVNTCTGCLQHYYTAGRLILTSSWQLQSQSTMKKSADAPGNSLLAVGCCSPSHVMGSTLTPVSKNAQDRTSGLTQAF